LHVLAAPGQFVNVTTNGEAIDKLIAVAKREFDYIVVDSGSRLNFVKTDLYASAASIYMVMQNRVPELRNANHLLGQFAKDGDPRFQIVINRYTDSVLAMDEQTISTALRRPADWKIPNDFRTAFRTQSTATPLALEDTPISKTLRQMARSVCAIQEVPEKRRKIFGISL
jgi:pilus assembly protein CpaE